MTSLTTRAVLCQTHEIIPSEPVLLVHDNAKFSRSKEEGMLDL